MNKIKQILELSKEHRDYTAKVLSEIVKIPSLSAQEQNVINKIKGLLVEAGIENFWIDHLGSLIAEVGNGPKKLAFDAHIDTVDTGDMSQWDFDPYCGEITANEVLGRGSVDQKGGAASMIAAAKILNDMGYDGEYTIYFAFTVMEEDCDGMCWLNLIEREKLRPDFAVLTEPTDCKVTRGHRGRMELDIEFSGISSHGSMPHLGDNAIYRASKAILEIEKLNEKLKEDDFLGKGTIVVSHIDSKGPSMCAVPDYARIHIDRRLTAGETEETVMAELIKAVDKKAKISVPEYRKKGYRGNNYPQKMYFPTWKTPIGHPLVKAGISAHKEIFGHEEKVGKWIFSTNGVAISGVHDIPCIGFGPGDEKMAHAPNEKIPIDDLVDASAFYAILPYILEGEK